MKISLVLYYDKPNRYSFNALVGAIESDDYFQDLKVSFVTHGDRLIAEIEEVLREYEKVVVGVSFATTQLWDTHAVMRKLRERYSCEILCIAGGPHPTGDPLGSLRMGFDIVVVGEGEATILDLLKNIERGEDFKDIRGIGFLDDQGKYRYTGRRPWIDLDKYPPFGIKSNKFGPIEITRGCPYACYFCQTPQILGGRPRHRSIDKICECVRVMKDKNLRDFRCITPNAFSYGSPDGKKLSISKVEELLSNIRGVLKTDGRIFFGSFPSEVRPEHVTKETLDLVLKYANNDNLIIGAQSGSQRVLNSCHRGHTVEDVFTAVDLTIKSGFKANVDFIFGLPEENEEDIRLTLEAMEKLGEMGARIHAHTFMPLPQTPFAKAPSGKISDDLRATIKRLVSKGEVYGDWKEQARIGENISNYLKSGKLS